MAKIILLSASDVKRALPMRAAIDSQKRAYTALATGQAALPLRTPVTVPDQNAVTLFMPARVGGDLGAKIVSVFPNNAARGLPMIHGAVIMVSAETGQPIALIDATYLTALRTGAASGAATELLARPDARTAAIFGAGAQARTQLLAVCEARRIEQAWIFDLNPDRVAAFMAEMQPHVAAALVAAPSPAEAVRDADVICTATTSPTPVFDGRDLKPGAHVNAVGSYTLQMQEIDSEVARRAGKIFVDSREAVLAETADVVNPLKAGLIAEADLIEIGAVAAGQHPGRTSNDEITFFKSCGIAVQDVAAGGEVLRRAKEMNLGAEIAS